MAHGGGEGLFLARTARGSPSAAPPMLLAAPAPSRASAVAAIAPAPFVELDCIRRHLPPEWITLVEQRAALANVSAERVLIGYGVISEDGYVAALARWLGVPFEIFEHRTRAC